MSKRVLWMAWEKAEREAVRIAHAISGADWTVEGYEKWLRARIDARMAEEAYRSGGHADPSLRQTLEADIPKTLAWARECVAKQEARDSA